MRDTRHLLIDGLGMPAQADDGGLDRIQPVMLFTKALCGFATLAREHGEIRSTSCSKRSSAWVMELVAASFCSTAGC